MIDLLDRMPKMEFLWMFVVLSFVCILTAWLITKYRTGFDSLPELSDPDMLSVALLRGGSNAVIRTVAFDMWSRNMIRIIGTDSDKRVSTVPHINTEISGKAVHRAIYEFVTKPKNVSELFSDKQFVTTVNTHLHPIRENLKSLRLLQNEKDIARDWQTFIATFAVIAGTAVTKIAMSVMHGYSNFNFGMILMVELFVSFVVLSMAVNPGVEKTTCLGRRYVKSLKKRYYGVKKMIKNNKLPPDMGVAFAIAVFGAGIIAGAEQYKTFGEAFAKNIGVCSGCGGCGGCGEGCGGCGGCGD